ncbi:hypothetical protein [Pseudomaricurvus sp. HS19]|uniref:hypothetical protein n=1 Tax=Pseudomaricurvus sp. HS19 TaxID=2692626 RepID=UPI001367B53B|nr:hypothetical protein [Pseudomaricurvus sp. HS19]MYM62648.1 hypothetical protein [Pseudomaricurvus sp. HS19]
MFDDPLKYSIACDRALMQVALKARQRDLIGGVIAGMGRRRPAPARIIARAAMIATDSPVNRRGRQS